MHQKAADLITQLEAIFRPLQIDLSALAAASSLDTSIVSRIVHLEHDPRLDEVMSLARCAGLVLVLTPRDFAAARPVPAFRARGAASFAVHDVNRFRDALRAFRRSAGVSPTSLARLCGVYDKAFLRVESGARTPTLGLTCDCIVPLGLELRLINETGLPRAAAALDHHRKQHAQSLAASLARQRPPPPKLPEAVRPLATALIAIADAHDLTARKIALAMRVDPRTLTERSSCGATFNPISSVPITARVATALGCELVVVPTSAVATIKELSASVPIRPLSSNPLALEQAARRQTDVIAARVRKACSDMSRDGATAGDLRDLLRLAEKVDQAQTAFLASQLAEAGFAIIAVPAAAAEKARRMADRLRPSPRRMIRKECRKTTNDRNRLLTNRFVDRLDRLIRPSHRIMLPSNRMPLQAVLDQLAATDLSIDLVDTSTRETVLRYRGRDAGELFGHIVDLRISRGFSLHSIGAGINLTHAAVRRAERPEVRRRALLSSVLRYAETIGLDLIPGQP